MCDDIVFLECLTAIDRRPFQINVLGLKRRVPSSIGQTQGQPDNSPEELRILDREPGKFLFGQWKNITVLAWAAQADANTIARLRRSLASVVGTCPGGRSTVSIIAEGLPPPTDDARERVADLMNGDNIDLACLAIVVNGSGFMSSVLRSMHTGMRIGAPRSYEMAMFGTTDELARWLPPLHLAKTGVHIDAAELRKIVCDALSAAAETAPSES